MCAQAGAEALREVTRETFGLQPRQWTEVDVRRAAIEELGRALGDTLGFFADGAEAEREAAG